LLLTPALGTLIAGPAAALPVPAPEALAALMYTSGTTGPAKGVRVTHRMLRIAAEGVARVTDARPGDVMFLWEPLYHVGGAQMLGLPGLVRVELAMTGGFSARRFWAQVAASGATHVHYLGGILQILLKQPVCPEERENRVRILWGGGCPAEVFAAARARWGFAIRECYGMTEMSSGAILFWIRLK
jgi:crotonobetaine/carnitine-CoA ligase